MSLRVIWDFSSSTGQIFYRDMCNKCLCGLKGTYACESNPCHQEMFGARWLMEWNLLYRMLFWMKDFFAIREDGRDQTLYARINTSLEFALSSSYGSDTFLVLYKCDHFFLTPTDPFFDHWHCITLIMQTLCYIFMLFLTESLFLHQNLASDS